MRENDDDDRQVKLKLKLNEFLIAESPLGLRSTHFENAQMKTETTNLQQQFFELFNIGPYRNV